MTRRPRLNETCARLVSTGGGGGWVPQLLSNSSGQAFLLPNLLIKVKYMKFCHYYCEMASFRTNICTKRYSCDIYNVVISLNIGAISTETERDISVNFQNGFPKCISHNAPASFPVALVTSACGDKMERTRGGTKIARRDVSYRNMNGMATHFRRSGDVRGTQQYSPSNGRLTKPHGL